LKPSPRTRRTLLAALLACAFLNAPAARSEERGARQNARVEAKQSAQKKPDAKASEKTDKDAKASAKAARARRETREAVAALKESAELARGFEDVYESVRGQAEAADAAWPFDEPWARAVLRRAWDATNAPGAEDRVQGFGTSEDAREDSINALEAARRFVIKAALKHDPRFGEALMREFERGVDERAAENRRPQTAAQESVAPADPADSNANGRRERTLRPADWQRLFIARQLLEEGDYRHAADIAAPLVAEGASFPVLDFILDLGARDAGAGEALYLRLLETTLADAEADANDVLLLSMPIVSPGLRVSVNADGSVNFVPVGLNSGYARQTAFAPRTQTAFFRTASAVLLRRRTTGAAAGDAAALYFAIGRLLPFFGREAPQLAPALDARMASLAAELEASRSEALRAKMEVSSLTPKNPTDPLALPLQLVAQAKTSDERDFARLTVVTVAARLALWSRARAAAEEIEGGEARRAARLAVAIQQVATVRRAFEEEGPEASVRADDFVERAADFVRASDVPPEARALGFAQAAEWAAGAAFGARADALLADAAGLAAQADRGTQRASALALVTLSAARAGSARVWEVLPAFVRAADEADELRYGAMLLEFNVGPSDRKLWVTAPHAPVSLDELFAAAARLDAVKTLTEARGFKDEELRAAALLAAGRAALEKNAGAAAAKNAGAPRPDAR
jgi:hypothetical protein